MSFDDDQTSLESALHKEGFGFVCSWSIYKDLVIIVNKIRKQDRQKVREAIDCVWQGYLKGNRHFYWKSELLKELGLDDEKDYTRNPELMKALKDNSREV
jgi:hypothetical protein